MRRVLRAAAQQKPEPGPLGARWPRKGLQGGFRGAVVGRDQARLEWTTGLQ